MRHVHRQPVRTSPPASPAESLIVLSDVHLGSDLTGGGPLRSRGIDLDLVHLLGHYRAQKPTGDRWRLVIAGDFIDFIGMSIPAEGEILETPPTDEEREHGLGSAEDHARVKLRRVAARHADIFRALAAFIEAGHAVTLVHGNHDVELHWQAVRDELGDVIFAHASPGTERAAFDARIEHAPWFYYVGGLVYVEHGHQYDPFCAVDHIMVPLSPLHPRRLAQGFCDVLLRFVVRPTRGLSEHGHERMGVADYAALGFKLGLRGAFGLFVRFVRAILELFKLRRAHLSEAAIALRAEHERRMALLAEAKRIGLDRLRALLALQSPPITRTIRGILASLLLDRIALGLAASLVLLGLALWLIGTGHFVWSAALVLLSWGLAHSFLMRGRHVCPSDQLAERASHLARLFPAAFVVMGHTHVPVCQPVALGESTYVNVGSWSESEGADSDESKASRLHLVIHPRTGGAEGGLFRWVPLAGPERVATA
jgi:UDP-2,3-diacylglucosamine pyrophosphatase LpxH